MKAIKTLLAVSVLAAAGAANASILTFDAGLSTDIINVAGANGHISGVGTATLDTATGVLDISLVDTNNTVIAGTGGVTSSTVTNQHLVLTGVLSGSAFTWTSGVNTLSNCVGTGGYGFIMCGSTPAGPQPFAADQNPITVGLAFGGLTNFSSTVVQNGTNVTTNYTLTNTTPTPAVPVPAAAWLFGSGLLGLAGTARRRRNA